MNDELKQKTNEALIGLIDRISQVEDFAIEQVPDVIRQLLMWNALVSASRFCASMFIFLGYLILIKALWAKYFKGVKYFKNETAFYEYVYACVICGVFIGIASILMIDFSWLQIWLAPKVWLIEYSAELIK